jgi:hypothetical protein
MQRRPTVGIASFIFVVACCAAASQAATAGPSVRERDWQNGDYDLGDRRLAFVNGRHAELSDDGSCSVCLAIREVTFGDVDGTERKKPSS